MALERADINIYAAGKLAWLLCDSCLFFRHQSRAHQLIPIQSHDDERSIEE